MKQCLKVNVKLKLCMGHGSVDPCILDCIRGTEVIVHAC
jgi:hypothetical protein